MMRLLKAVIARLSGTTMEQDRTQTTVEPTQTAGLVSPEPTAQLGNKPSAETTQPQRQVAPSKRKRNSSAVQSTTPARSRKQEQKPVQTTSGKRGRPRKTPV